MLTNLRGPTLYRYRTAGGQAVERAEQQIQVSYAWRKSAKPSQGRALQWWLAQLQCRVTGAPLLGERSASV